MKRPSVLIAIAIIGAVAIIVLAGIIKFNFINDDVVTMPPVGNSDVKNATYIVDNRPVTLVAGKAEESIPDSNSKIVTTYFGNEVAGDFNNDSLTDKAFLLTQTTGGSGTFYYIVAALKTATGYHGTNAILLGDRIAPQTTEWRDGGIVVNFADRKANEPMTVQPSVGVSKYFVVSSDGTLISK